jgi:hypothetical protein
VSEPEAAETEEVEIEIRADGPEQIDENGRLALRALDLERLRVVAHVLAKSAVLSSYEQRATAMFDRIEGLADELRRGSRVRRGRQLAREIGDLLLAQARTVGRAEVAEKPELIWDDPALDRSYEHLAAEFELRERDRALAQDRGRVQDVETYLGLLLSRQNIRVEWYIVVLIIVEIALRSTPRGVAERAEPMPGVDQAGRARAQDCGACGPRANPPSRCVRSAGSARSARCGPTRGRHARRDDFARHGFDRSAVKRAAREESTVSRNAKASRDPRNCSSGCSDSTRWRRGTRHSSDSARSRVSSQRPSSSAWRTRTASVTSAVQVASSPSTRSQRARRPSMASNAKRGGPSLHGSSARNSIPTRRPQVQEIVRPNAKRASS